MPRRKVEEPLIEPILALPSPRVKHQREHDVDPYEAPPGAVPIKTSVKPIKRKQTAADIKARKEAELERKMRAERYARYLDAMAEFDGDQEQALADVYGIPVEEARVKRLELQEDVRSGLGSTQLAEVLERNDLTLLARVNLLRKHAYSKTPAASLKALDMIAELEGTRADVGSFEQYLRMAKEQKG